MTKKKNTFIVKLVLVLINVLLIISAIIFSWAYSRRVSREQQQAQREAFDSTIESMKQVSSNYLSMELGYAKDWAKYIDEHNMSMQDALQYIDETNTQRERYAHIVDMETLEAYSVNGSTGLTHVNCYRNFKDEDTDTYNLFLNIMNRMYAMDNDDADIDVLGKYRPDDIQLNVVSVGTKVTLTMPDGTRRGYLLLRLIPVEKMRKIWVFPVAYLHAEIGIITKSGAYVIPSNSMKSISFSEYIRGYNFEDDYNKVDELIRQLSDTDNGMLEYKNSKGEMCYWYYSSFGEKSGLHIIGCIPERELYTQETDWTIVAMTCGILLLLTLIDGAYVFYINQQLRETARYADHASEAKTQFLSTMSHDIRTPMNAIIGMTNIALQHVREPKQVEAALQKVSLASQHLLTLINNILDISKIESGNFTLNPSTISLNQSIDKLIDIMHIDIEKKNIVFEVERDICYPYLIADELRLNQIFINILSNAVKYTPQGGHIRMSVSEELLDATMVRMSYCVIDNGIGMSGEFQQHMYEMFTRDKDSRVDKSQGTGLGLAIVKQMVELMGGTITCDSALGRGTKFTIVIDLQRADEKERVRRSELARVETEESGLEGIRILVAEDNELNWEVISELLQQYHIVCDRAENGQICVDRMEASAENLYDLILMDIQMPKMDGRKACRLIRASERDYVRNIPIYAMTADAFTEDIQECMDAGMNGHFAKPVDINKVLEVLRALRREKEK